MMQPSSKMMTHHFVMTLPLRIKHFDFSCDIEYNSRTDVFRDVISLIINQCDPRRRKGASGGHKVSASRTCKRCPPLIKKVKVKILSLYRYIV